MTVVYTFDDFNLHQLSVGTDFSVPLGAYAIEATEAGDASGGVILLRMDYPGNYLFSVESVTAVATSVSSHDVLVTWEPQITRGGTGFVSFHDLELAATRYVMESRDNVFHLPLSVSYPGSNQVRLTVEFDVNGNGVVYRSAVWGYYWDFRAAKTVSGPVRPR